MEPPIFKSESSKKGLHAGEKGEKGPNIQARKFLRSDSLRNWRTFYHQSGKYG